MGQGIKGMLGTKSKIAIVIVLLLFVFSILVVTKPRDTMISGNIAGKSESLQFQKSEKDDHYYISFILYQGDKAMKLECTKEQYNYMSDKNEEYYIFFRYNFFNQKTGKILELDKKPIVL